MDEWLGPVALEVEPIMPCATELEAAGGVAKLPESIALQDFNGRHVAGHGISLHAVKTCDGKRVLQGQAYCLGGMAAPTISLADTVAQFRRVEVLAPDPREVDPAHEHSVTSHQELIASPAIRIGNGRSNSRMHAARRVEPF